MHASGRHDHSVADAQVFDVRTYVGQLLREQFRGSRGNPWARQRRCSTSYSGAATQLGCVARLDRTRPPLTKSRWWNRRGLFGRLQAVQSRGSRAGGALLLVGLGAHLRTDRHPFGVGITRLAFILDPD